METTGAAAASDVDASSTPDDASSGGEASVMGAEVATKSIVEDCETSDEYWFPVELPAAGRKCCNWKTLLLVAIVLFIIFCR